MIFFSEDNSSFSDIIIAKDHFPIFISEKKDIFYTTKNIEKKELINGLKNKDNVNKLNEKTVKVKSDKNNCFSNDTQNNIEKKNKIPEFYSMNDIKTQFGDMLKGVSVDLFKKDQKILEAEDELQSYMKKKIKYDDFNEELKFNGTKRKRGRKKRNDLAERIHGKYSSDNIIKKIKGALFKSLVQFINKILQRDKIIKDLNYKKYINQLKKDINIKYLHLCIKDLLSFEISPYKSCNVNSNKDNIKKILEEEKSNEMIMYIFNMKFRDWIDIFTMKKEIKLVNGYEIIEKSLPKITDLLKDILIKNDIIFI
jgi:hypothetical protein